MSIKGNRLSRKWFRKFGGNVWKKFGGDGKNKRRGFGGLVGFFAGLLPGGEDGEKRDVYGECF